MRDTRINARLTQPCEHNFIPIHVPCNPSSRASFRSDPRRRFTSQEPYQLRLHLHLPNNGHHHNVFLLLESIFQQWNSTSWLWLRRSRASPLEGTGYKLCTNEINPELPAGPGYGRRASNRSQDFAVWIPVSNTRTEKENSTHAFVTEIVMQASKYMYSAKP